MEAIANAIMESVSLIHLMLSIFSFIIVLFCARLTLKLFRQELNFHQTSFRQIALVLTVLNGFEALIYFFFALGMMSWVETFAGFYLLAAGFFVVSLYKFSLDLGKRDGSFLNSLTTEAVLLLPSIFLVILHVNDGLVTGYLYTDYGMTHIDGPYGFVFDVHILVFLFLSLYQFMKGTSSNDRLVASRNRFTLYAFIPIMLFILAMIMGPKVGKFFSVGLGMPILSVYALVAFAYVSKDDIVDISDGLTKLVARARIIVDSFGTAEMTLDDYLESAEKAFLTHELDRGEGLDQIAKRLDVHPTSLRTKLNKYDIHS